MAVLSDPVSDFLTRLKNASAAGNESFSAPYSKMKEAIANILAEEGYVWKFEVSGEGVQKTITVTVKYSDAGKAVLTNVKRVSKPGLRQYVGAGEVPRVLNGLGISILSTSKGLLTGSAAKKQNVGGEHLANIW
ncbi:30S ribosomal protein S8 [Rubritalea marina]|uniref:30S ribosomal protein S8 n=1 Tax=Rubritalea marina TaxID=361055 RepID=UPI000379C206|nr:30S ribosomal protein S8 [Rubritalea marina]